jgi:hypothetical protein
MITMPGDTDLAYRRAGAESVGTDIRHEDVDA